MFNFVSSLSLLLCVVTAMLWARSYWCGDRVNATVRGSSANRQLPVWMCALISGKGGFGISEAHSCAYYSDEVTWRRVLDRDPVQRRCSYRPMPAAYPHWTPGESEWRWGGFQWIRIDRLEPNSWSIQRSIVLPYWLPCLLTAITPTIWLRARLVRSGRKRRGFCVSCGYDLHATPERCPECGKDMATA
jgi:hypothetical protein